MNKSSNNIISNLSELKSRIVRYVVNNHKVKVNHSEFYWIGSDEITDVKWFLTCSYQSENFAIAISSEQSITIDMVKNSMKEMVNEIVEKIKTDEEKKNAKKLASQAPQTLTPTDKSEEKTTA